MADLRENVFQMLDDEDAPEAPVSSEQPAKASASLAPISAPITSTLESSDSNNNSWTDVSSTRTRRLAPQCTLTKQDFAAENPRTPKAQSSSQDADKIAKKKGLIFILAEYVSFYFSGASPSRRIVKFASPIEASSRDGRYHRHCVH